VITGAASAAIGSAGIFGTSIGATGITGVLMSAGFITATPIWVPLAVGGSLIGIFVGAYRVYKLRNKVRLTPTGQEAQFTEQEAQAIERVIRLAVRHKRFTQNKTG
jgi:Na+/glutamate symporter